MNWWEIECEGSGGFASVRTELEQESRMFKVFPNPASDQVYIESNVQINGLAEIEVMDMKGAVVKRTRMMRAGKISVPVSLGGLRSGQYVIKMKTAEGVYYYKVVKL